MLEGSIAIISNSIEYLDPHLFGGADMLFLVIILLKIMLLDFSSYLKDSVTLVGDCWALYKVA